MTTETAPEAAPAPTGGLYVLPPRGTVGHAPLLANVVDVGGGTDLLTIDFYFVADNTYSRVFAGEDGDGIERLEDRVVIRSEPVARLALPITVAADLLLQMISTALDGVPQIQRQFADAVDKVQSIAQRANAIKGGGGG